MHQQTTPSAGFLTLGGTLLAQRSGALWPSVGFAGGGRRFALGARNASPTGALGILLRPRVQSAQVATNYVVDVDVGAVGRPKGPVREKQRRNASVAFVVPTRRCGSIFGLSCRH